MALKFTTSFLKDSIEVLRYYKRLGERAMAQVPDELLLAAPDPDSNSVAIVVKHLAGNMRSRFSDFLIGDGEKPERKRDTEFEAPPKTRAELLAIAHLSQKVYIRSEAHSVTQGHQPAACSLRVSRRADCLPGEAFRRPQLEFAHHSSRQIRRVYDQSSITGHPMKNGQPAAAWIKALRADGVEFNPRLRPSNDVPAPAASDSAAPSASNGAAPNG